MTEVKRSEIIDILLELPARIRTESQYIADHMLAIEEIEYDIAEIKNIALTTVLNAKVDNKPAYTNDQQRKSAVDELLKNSENYEQCLIKLSKERRGLSLAQIEHAFLRDTLRVYLALAEMQKETTQC